MSLTTEITEIIKKRNAQIYADWLGGKKQKQLAHDYEMHQSSITRILMEYRIDHNLPNGRKHAKFAQ